MILLDTHVAIWLFLEPMKLSQDAREAIRKAHGGQAGIGCSVISLYEMAYAVHQRRLLLNSPAAEFLAEVQARLKIIAITPIIAIAAAQLPRPMHRDPMDRLIAATAITENCTLLTADRKLRASGVCKTLW